MLSSNHLRFISFIQKYICLREATLHRQIILVKTGNDFSHLYALSLKSLMTYCDSIFIVVMYVLSDHEIMDVMFIFIKHISQTHCSRWRVTISRSIT
jgi:hypothetical protein